MNFLNPSGTTVVHVRRSKFDVYIGRDNRDFKGSKWGNPFPIRGSDTREIVIEKYKRYIKSNPDLMGSLHELKGKILGCWCHPSACHGDVLVQLLNEQIREEQRKS